MGSSGSLNHVYRTVWNQALGAMVAVAEISTGRGKSVSRSGACAGAAHTKPLLQLKTAVFSVAIALAWGVTPTLVLANPTGGVAIQGQATLTSNGSNLLVITQNGAGLNHSAINWQSFSIPTGSSTYFQQPNASSTSINRVVTNTPSLIFGTLGSNGNLVLVNQSGITVGAGAVVDTAGFTASALRMGDADAIAGRLRFGDTASALSSVSVYGSVLARSGDVVLLGSRVDTGSNALVQAPNGSTVLAAGQQIEITGRGLEGIVMQVQAPADSAVNLGTLKGDAVGIFAGTLSNSGAIQATTVTTEGGKIFLRAMQKADVGGLLSASGTQGGVVDVAVTHSIDPDAPGLVVQTATIDANGSSGAGGQVRIAADNVLSTGAIAVDGATQGGSVALLAANRALSTSAAIYSAKSSSGKGGNILVSADVSNYTSGTYSASGETGGSVTLAGAEIKLAGTQVDASGNQGGGSIHVGGITHGGAGFSAQGVALANAATVLTNSHTSFKADALQSGNGGDVVLWSDDTLAFNGSISAKGGSVSGNGGFAEVSGLKSLTYAGTTDLTAAHGSKGTLLLDPKNITVVAGNGLLSGGGSTTYLELIDPTPGASEGFGGSDIKVMGNGEVVVASPLDIFAGSNAGAVYFFDTTGAVNATVLGAAAGDRISSGGITALANDKLLISSPNFGIGLGTAGKGAITWVDGTTGKLSNLSVGGVVGARNSLVGQATGDGVGLNSSYPYAYGSIANGNATLLTSGNLIVDTPYFGSGDGITVANAKGAVTWMNPATGLLSDGSSGGVIGASNSVVGASQGDRVGSNGITVLANDKLLINSPYFGIGTATAAAAAGMGAITWLDGTTGKLSDHSAGGTVGTGNSLLGQATGDVVGYNNYYPVYSAIPSVGSGNAVLNNGDLIIYSALFGSGDGITAANAKGAVTWMNPATGLLSDDSFGGTIGAANSVVGAAQGDRIGSGGIYINSLSNFAVASPYWGTTNGLLSTAKGAVTPVSGSTGKLANGNTGTIVGSGTDSLVGSISGDQVGTFAMVLGQQIGPNQSAIQAVGDNLLVFSDNWTNINTTSVAAGAVTWINGTTGLLSGGASLGAISPSNSLVGNSPYDRVGTTATWNFGTQSVRPVNGLLNLTGNTNFAIRSGYWGGFGTPANIRGAVTWFNGSTGTVGTVSSSNSLVGSHARDLVGTGFVDTNTSDPGVVALPNGDYVVVSSQWNGGTGAVTWVNGSNGKQADGVAGGGIGGVVGGTTGPLQALSIVGVGPSSYLGAYGLTVQANGGSNFVIKSPWLDLHGQDSGAVTWVKGSTGQLSNGAFGGAVSDANSLTGGFAFDNAGDGGDGVFALSNGSFIAKTPVWKNSGISTPGLGAVSWINGATGQLSNGLFAGQIDGIATGNSLVGSTVGDMTNVGIQSVGAGSTSNALITNASWSGGRGAVTWMNASTGALSNAATGGPIDGSANGNSLVASTVGDMSALTIQQLGASSNNNVLLENSAWHNVTNANAGAITWMNASNGKLVGGVNTGGTIGAGNSLLGSSAGDNVGSITNSPVIELNALDGVGGSGLLVRNSIWSTDKGAVTWMDGKTGLLAGGASLGVISASNSLVGDTGNQVGSQTVISLGNGNYVLPDPFWSGVGNAIPAAGAVTWINGQSGQLSNSLFAGLVSASNSLVGSNAGDGVGNFVYAFGANGFANNNYLVASHNLSGGALTWVNGSNGHTADGSNTVSPSNSLMGSSRADNVDQSNLLYLYNNDTLAIVNTAWNSNAGSVTWMDPSTGQLGNHLSGGVVGAANSLVGQQANDSAGSGGVLEFSNGKVAVLSPNWANGAAGLAGAVTVFDGTTGAGSVGAVSPGNSLVGSLANDQVGSGGTIELNNGFLALSPYWNTSAGAVTYLDYVAPTVGPVLSTNSLVGSNSYDEVGYHVNTLNSGNVLIRSPYWGAGTGALTWMNGTNGTLSDGTAGGVVSSANSLVGTFANDGVGNSGYVELTGNGNLVIGSRDWGGNGQLGSGMGAVTWMNGTTGKLVGGSTGGEVTALNSLVGTNSGDMVGSIVCSDCNPALAVTALSDGNYAVNSLFFANNTGAITWANGSTGLVGTLDSSNSAPVRVSSNLIESPNLPGKVVVGSGTANGGYGGVYIIGATGTGGLIGPNFTDGPNANATIGAGWIADALTTANVTLQANNDITVNAEINVTSPNFQIPSSLTLQAGRSINVNANITTANGDLTLVANDSVANGVVDANRDTGAASLSLAANVTLDVGAGNVALKLLDGAGNTNNAVGTLSQGAGSGILASNLDVQSFGGLTLTGNNLVGRFTASNTGAAAIEFNNTGALVLGSLSRAGLSNTLGTIKITAAGDLSLTPQYGFLNSGASGTAVVLATGGNFSDGGNQISTANGRWLVYSTDPRLNTLNPQLGLLLGALDFKQYGVSAGTAVAQSIGNGFLYSLAPSVTASLNGSYSKIYDRTPAIALTSADFTLTPGSGFSGLTDVLSVTSMTGNFNSPHVGLATGVTATGMTFASAVDSVSGASVYGYQFANTTTAPAPGSITKAALSLTAPTLSKTYDGTVNYVTSAAQMTAFSVGLVAGDSLASVTLAYADKNAGTANKAADISAVTINDGNGGNNYNVTLTRNTNSTIDKAVVTLTAPSVAKTYDGGTAYTTTAADLSAMSTALFGGDTVAGAALTYADKNAGSGNKAVSLGAYTINDGNGGANYSVTSVGNSNSTINPLTVSWTGNAGTGLWSSTGNWSSPFVPDGANVITQQTLSVTNAVYDLTIPISVQAITASGSFTLQSGTLNISGDLITPSYTQTGGSLSVSGALTVQSAFSQTAGDINKTGPVSITQTSGDLTVGNITGSSISLQASSGAIKQWPSTGLTGLVTLRTTGGASLTDSANRVTGFAVADVVSGGVSTRSNGNITLTNASVLDMQGISLASGNLSIDNTGGISNSGTINVDAGTVDIVAHSPITIGNSVTSSGNITLAALTPDGTSNITLNGSMTSTAGGISIQAYNNFIQNSNLSAALAIDVSTIAGNMTFGPGAYSVGNPVMYTVNGAVYMPPWIASTLSGGATDFVVAFLDQFQAVLDAQQVAAIDDPLGLKQRGQEGIVVEGETCKP